jgi:hypothetical protein
MTHCKKVGCPLTPWRRGCCYTHYPEVNVFFFDRGLGRFVKQIRRRSGEARAHSDRRPSQSKLSYSPPLETPGRVNVSA